MVIAAEIAPRPELRPGRLLRMTSPPPELHSVPDSVGLDSELPTVSVIVVSYNTCAMTLRCLQSIADETSTPHEVLVVDNASADGSAAAIAQEFPTVRLFTEDINHGFARGCNLAARRARGRYILLLNPDTVVLDGAIDRLIEFAERRPDRGMWGGRTLYDDLRLNPTNCWRKMTLWTITARTFGLDSMFPRSDVFNREGYGGWDRNTERAVDIITGCFLLIERSTWDALGGFDERYVMYGEEADLFRRAEALGVCPTITPTAAIVHHVGAASAVRADKFVWLLRAKITLIDRWFPAWQRPIARLVLVAWPWTRSVASRIIGLVTRREHQGNGWREVWRRRSEWIDGYPPSEGTADLS